MKYLFFDIECANCCNGTGKICEFGYVLTDEQFNEVDRKLFLINPNDNFDWFVVKKMLAYSVSVYRQSPDYKYYFDKIQALFVDDEIMIFGHTVETDIKYLNDEATRYRLPFFNCKFYDAKFMYNTYAATPGKSFGVSKICTELGIAPPIHEHKSVDDAYATMTIVKEICRRMGVDVYGLIEQCEDCKGETKEGEIKTVVGERARLKREELEKIYGVAIKDNFVRGDNKIKFLRFLDGVSSQGEISNNELTGKKLNISLNYEYTHYKQMLSVVQLLKNCGCTYCLKASEADYFVTYQIIDLDGTEKRCSRQKYVNEAIEHGAAIKIISFDELLHILSVTIEDIEAMPYPEASCFAKKWKSAIEKKEGSNAVYTSDSQPTTLGDLLNAQGISLLAEIKDADDKRVG